MEIAFVVPVRRLRGGIHHRPVRVIPEQNVRILGQFRDAVLARRGDEPLGVAAAFDVAPLQRISTTKGDLATAVQHLAAGIEVLIDDDDRRAKVAGANGGGKSGAAGADDDDVCLVIPPDRVNR